MTPQEMIDRFGLTLAPDHGKDAIRIASYKRKPTDKQRAEMSACKVEILALLRFQAARFAEERAEREAKWKAEHEAEKARDQMLIDEAKKGLPALLAQVPEDAVRVTVTKTGYFDGDPILEYKADGEKISWSDVTRVGGVHATREGAMNPFWSERVAYITPERLAEIRAERKAKADAKAAKKAEAEAERAAKFAQAQESGERVYIRQWSDECDDPREECSLDIVAEYAMPDGSTKLERSHTW